MIKMLEVGGVDFTPYLTLKNYNVTIEDLDKSAERSIIGVLTRERVARVPTIEVTIKAMLQQADITKLLTACRPQRLSVRYYNPETGRLESSYMYAKVKYPSVYGTAGDSIRYESFTIKFIAYQGVTYA